MFEKTFCSGPWFHIGINYDGSYAKCRWAKDAFNKNKNYNVSNTSIIDFYNSKDMTSLRNELLAGDKPSVCETCYYEESYGKLNGRQRQLKKSGINVEEFDLTARSSPHYSKFEYSYRNSGVSQHQPTDLQVWLGNTCNSACIMCNPLASSKLEEEYKLLNKLNPKQFEIKKINSWTKDKSQVHNIAEQICNIENLGYIHFLGGETLYEESFYTICDRLMETDNAKDIIVGITTNGTIYKDKLNKYIETFKEFHLGISIEAVTDLNDYIRWPGKISSILPNIEQFLLDREKNKNLYLSLRITPNIFSVAHIDKLFVFMIENKIIAESCNILFEPECLRMELLPENIRQDMIEKIKKLVDYYQLSKEHMVNIRVPNMIDQVTANTILDYYEFLRTYTPPNNIEESRHNLVSFIKTFEMSRNNSILDYLPEYAEFLKSYGY